MTGDRLPVFFLKGVGQGLATALFRKETLTDPLEPMPTVPEWLASYGVTPGDTSAFDRCEADWYTPEMICPCRLTPKAACTLLR